MLDKRSTLIKYLKEVELDFIYKIENEKHAEVFFKLKTMNEEKETLVNRITFYLESTY
jgi:hypothetical protein